jgi:hypothetical protein
LHECEAQSVAPNSRLVRLMSLVSLPPSASVKSGKATRYYDYLACGNYPHYLHEAPPAQAVGKALALELLGEFDPNRQGEHFRRIERAVAYYSHSILNGGKASIKGVQRASGLSWADARTVISRPFFSQLVFEHQCRSLVVEPCPECEELGRRLAGNLGDANASLLSSESSW